MSEHLPEITALLAMAGLVIPGALILGHKIGQITSSTRSAHHRIDRLEKQLTEEFRRFTIALDNSISKAWTNCPMAQKEHVSKGDK